MKTNAFCKQDLNASVAASCAAAALSAIGCDSGLSLATRVDRTPTMSLDSDVGVDRRRPDSVPAGEAEFEPEEGIGGAYCPSEFPTPAEKGNYCKVIPSGLAAPIRWWAWKTTYFYSACSSTMTDNDVGTIGAGNTIILPHDSEYLGDASSTNFAVSAAWGLSPVFLDKITSKKFHFNHLKPGWNEFDATADVGKVFKAGTFVGVSGGDTCETGYACSGKYGAGSYACNGKYNCKKEDGTWATAVSQNSTAAHFCVVSPNAMATNFPPNDPLPTCDPSVGPTKYSQSGLTTRTVDVPYVDPAAKAPTSATISFRYYNPILGWQFGSGTFALASGEVGSGVYRFVKAINGSQFKFVAAFTDGIATIRCPPLGECETSTCNCVKQ